MAKVELTKKIIDSSVCPAEKQYIYIMDKAVPGLGVQITANGAKSYIVRYQYQGKRHSKVFAAVDKLSLSAARTRAREILALYTMGKDPFAAQKNNSKLTLQQLIDKWYSWAKDHNTSRPSLRSSYGGLRQYFDFGRKKAESLTTQDIVQFQSARTKAGIKPSTINRNLSDLKFLYQWAMSQGIISSEYEYPSTKKLSEALLSPKVHHLTNEQIDKLIKAAMAKTTPGQEYLKWFILFALNTGVRPASICGLVWKDVIRLDEDGGEIRLRADNIKTKKDVHVSISATAAEILQTLAQRPHGQGDKIFTTKTPSNVNRNIKRLMQKAGLPPELSAYSLRHNYATRLYLLGASPTEIQIQMCHSSYKTTQKYIHANYEHQKNVANLLQIGTAADLTDKADKEAKSA